MPARAGPAELPPLPASTGDRLGWDRFLGKVPVLLTFTGAASSPATADVVKGFDEHLAGFGTHRVQALVVVASDASDMDRFLPRRTTTVPVLADAGGDWREHFGVPLPDDQAISLLVDPAGVVVERVVAPAGPGHASEVLAMAERWAASAALPSSTRTPGSVGSKQPEDGTAGLVTNVDGDAPSG